MKLILFFFIVVSYTHNANVFAKADFSKSSSFKVKKQAQSSKPSQKEIKLAVQSLKDLGFYGGNHYVDCYGFCDEVCEVIPGGVCYCDGQSYSCPGEPVSY